MIESLNEMTVEQKLDAIIGYLARTDERFQSVAFCGEKNHGTIPQPVSARDTVFGLMSKAGVQDHLLGYNYLFQAIIACLENRSLLHGITKDLYPQIAKQFGTSSSRVERAIRHAIEVAWDNCDIDVLTEMFGNTISGCKGKPTNAHFIARMVRLTENELRRAAA